MRTLIIRFLRVGLQTAHPCLPLFLLLGLILPALASAAAYTDNHDGTVTDTATGLTWMRCAMGQTWDGNTCTGTASPYTWDQAKALTSTFAGKSDWRLPNITELQTIVDLSRYNPVIDPVAFPNTASSIFWSNTSDPAYAWVVYFYNGSSSDAFSKFNDFHVRLVRGGQSLGSLSAHQTIGAISLSPATLAVGGTTTVSAAATSGLAVSFTSTTTSVCTVSGTNGSTVTGVAAGTCTIAANQAGNASYSAAAQVTQSITVSTSGTASISNARVFAYAEANYPDLFSGISTAEQTTYQGNSYNYKYYPTSKNYLAVDTSGVIFILGPYTGNAITRVGTVASFANTITAWEGAIPLGTDNTLGMKINGAGYFILQDSGGGWKYSLNGQFKLDTTTGFIVSSATSNKLLGYLPDAATGSRLNTLSPISIPPGVTGLTIGPDGTITAKNTGGTPRTLGWVALAAFQNTALLPTTGEWAPPAGSGTLAFNILGSGGNGLLQPSTSLTWPPCTSTQVLQNGVCVTPAPAALPDGYVSQGGLTWMPVTFYKTWADANAYCANTAINGQTGWRLPTLAELSGLTTPPASGTGTATGGLYGSGAMNGQGWSLNSTWSSTPYSTGTGDHYGVYLSNSAVILYDARAPST